MESFTIEADGLGNFHVRSTTPDDPDGHIVVTLPSYRQAREWIIARESVDNPN